MKTKLFTFHLFFMMSLVFVAAQETKLTRISVDGNKFVNAQNETIVFKGINIADPDRLEKLGQWKKVLFEELNRWGANIVRFPVHPIAWRERGEEEYLKLLDQGIQWAKESGLYVIIDWHSIGNLRTGLFQAPMYDTSIRETLRFWYTVSRRYADEPAVALYEIFNEPTTFNNQLGSLSWSQWTEIVTDIITVIKANNPHAVMLVAGFNWAYDLTPVMHSPLPFDNIAYVSHPYPQKREQPWVPQWERDFGFVADNYPVIATEIGYMYPDQKGAHIPCLGDEEYGRTIMDYFDSKGISWVAWVFDPDWSPQLIKDWNYTPTRAGTFFKNEMLKR
ncbi:glycoside hydrolase family 5 protein [Thermophagus xiamenensis]|uniref:Cellulase (Glycosyl hydrolase family 5) n=1 Tax=Thermophagus xiamenensis TaxID=385682 RepID=A0A1I2AG41_9BACT|nr:cellulase family glycosylhydrolase [Thermophagus xiamenensis]SFE42931.1 Cellulase (glycosyl hydrolase family 5) [Thermophagus xiamenensis]